MRIAVNARCLSNRNMGGGYYTFHLLEQLVRLYPQHEFVLLTDALIDVGFVADVRVVGKPVKGFFSLDRWMREVKVELKSIGADVFVSLDGTGCSKISVSQVIGLTDLNFLKHGSFFTRMLQQKRFKKLISHTQSIVTVSQDLKKQLTSTYSLPGENVHVIYKAPKAIFKSLEWEQKETVKSSYTDGKEFFLFTGGFEPANDLLNVLKAFSQFKKWQQSEMKLVITGDTSVHLEGMQQKIETFKFRNDIVLLGKISSEQFHQLLASAYALLYPSSGKRFGMPVLEAMRSGTPVITSRSIAAEVGGEAVIYINAEDATDIGDQMIKLYKDEDLRSKLVAAGLAHSAGFNWQNSAEQLWQVIEKRLSSDKKAEVSDTTKSNKVLQRNPTITSLYLHLLPQ